MYTELPLKERFEAAATEALSAVELFSHYVLPKAEMAVMLMANGLALVPINAPPGGDDAASIASAWASMRRSSACLSRCKAKFRCGVANARGYAESQGSDGPAPQAGRRVAAPLPASLAAWQVWDGCVLRVCRRAFAPPDRIRLIGSAGS